MTQQKRLEWDQRAEVSRISLGYGGRRPVNRTKPSDETEWGWGREWKPLLLYSEPPAYGDFRLRSICICGPQDLHVCVLLLKLQ